MKRYFYSGNPFTKKLLDSQFNLLRQQDKIYRDALLAALKLQPQKIIKFNLLRQEILNMTIQQQTQYANNYHMQSLYTHFDSLHKNSRNKQMMVRGKQSLVKDLVDPDKFPVWDLKKKPTLFYSIWNTIIGKIRYDFGHQLIVKNSLIQHPQGGRGVFINLASRKKQIEIGDFIGLVSGTVYPFYQYYKKIRIDTLKSYERIPEHLHFPSGKVLQLGQFNQYDHVTKTNVSLQPVMINPYAVGQFINHPPYGQNPNVIFSEIQFKQSFFPSYLRKYLPYNYDFPKQVNPKKKKPISIFGIFARQPIKNNQQLYVDYCQNHIYPIENIPQWMIQPNYPQNNLQQSQISTQNKKKFEKQAQLNPSMLNFSKGQYQHPSPTYLRVLQKYALKQKQQQYQKYLKVVKYRPNKVIYDGEQFQIRAMNTKLENPGMKKKKQNQQL